MKRFEGAKIKTARLAKGWSVSDLHFLILQKGSRVSLQSLRNWENNRSVPSCNHLIALAEVFEKGEGYFFV